VPQLRSVRPESGSEVPTDEGGDSLPGIRRWRVAVGSSSVEGLAVGILQRRSPEGGRSLEPPRLISLRCFLRHSPCVKINASGIRYVAIAVFASQGRKAMQQVKQWSRVVAAVGLAGGVAAMPIPATATYQLITEIPVPSTAANPFPNTAGSKCPNLNREGCIMSKLIS
jgi:hypothetical protein